ncbi:MAG: MCE family protein [Candidatus Omnitrophica bacterium]|nr:MCE family protein [Candidatus Omnitrophota bacterium]
MEDKSFELKVGIFVFIGIMILFIIVFSLGKVYIFQPGYYINIVYNFAGGISESAPVRLAGVDVGEIDKIRIYYDDEIGRTRVNILVWIKKDVKIERDSIVRINTLGLLGERYLEIIPGTQDAGFVTAEGVLIGEDPVMMDELAEDLKDLADSAGVIMGKLERGEGTIGKFLTDDTVYNNVEEFTDDIKRNPWKLLRKTSDNKRKKKN